MMNKLWNKLKVILSFRSDSSKTDKLEDKAIKPSNFAFQLRNVIIDGDPKYFRLRERVDP